MGNMNFKSKTVVIRTVYISVMVIVFAFLIVFCTMTQNIGGYSAGLTKPEASDADIPDRYADNLAEPEFFYDSLSLNFGGNICAGSMLGSSSYGTINSFYSENGAEYFFGYIDHITKNDSMTFAALSSVFSDSELEPTSREENGDKGWYKAPTDMVSILLAGGIDALSIESDGLYSYKTEGYNDTVSALESKEIKWGNNSKAVYCEENGIKIAVYPCTYKEENLPGIISWIERAAKSNDFVSVYLISENSEDNSVVSDKMQSDYRSFITAGADLVVGTNCSSLMKCEKYGGGFIAYSLGDLLDGSDRYSGKYSAIVSVELKINDGGTEETSYTVIPLRTYDEVHLWHPEVLDPVNHAEEYGEILKILKDE